MRTLRHCQYRPRRRAALLITVLVFFTLAILLFGNWLKTAALAHRQLKVQQHAMQAELLADAGLDRARVQLARNPSYKGESWQLAAENFGGSAAGQVALRVEPVSGEPDARTLRAVADFPSEGIARTRRSKTIKIQLPPNGEKP